MVNSVDYLVIGAGVVGLSIAREIKTQNPQASVVVLEKESAVALHASGRNSGVLHAGFYYSPDSLKAELTRDGNLALRDFCAEYGIKIQSPGKVVVTKSEAEIPQLLELHRRGIANGVNVELISEKELHKLEPRATTHHQALWSPNTGVADPAEVVRKLAEDFVAKGGIIHLGTKMLKVKNHKIITNNGDFSFGHLVNSGGLYADKIAKKFGFSQNHTVMPFIGLYRYAPSLAGTFSRHIYPVPDLRNPFLGVHLTVTVDGKVKIGPTAIPVLGREQYKAFSGLNISEVFETLSLYPKFLFSKNHNALDLIRNELPKMSSSVLAGHAEELIPGLDKNAFDTWGKPGIRAQMFNRQEGKLEMDFLVEGDSNSTHVLNAVSPAWTTSISFAQYVYKQLL